MNPKDRQGAKKPNLSVLPFAPLLEVIPALYEGRRKYGPWNWRAEKVSETIYADAAIRHLMQFIAGEDVDPDSGVHHISKAIAGLLVVRDAQLHGCSIDDRLVDQNLDIARIIGQLSGVNDRYPEPVESALPPRGATPIDASNLFDVVAEGDSVEFLGGRTGTVFALDEDDEELPISVEIDDDYFWYGSDGFAEECDNPPPGCEQIVSIDGNPLKGRIIEAQPLDQEAVDECHRAEAEEASCENTLLRPSLVGCTVLTRGGRESVLELNEGSDRYPYQYQDGGILRTVASDGRYHDGDGVKSELDIIAVRIAEFPLKDVPQSETLIGLVERLAEYYGIDDFVSVDNDRVARSWSQTVAGGGSYVIKQSDVGKTAVTRDGTVVTIDSVDKSGTWPVNYESPEWNDCTTRTGYADADASGDLDRVADSSDVEEMEPDIVRVYHKGKP